LYILLCGYPPFYGDTDAEIIEAVKKGVYDFDEEEWNDVSLECKELITKMLTRDPNKRYTSEQAIHHIWIKSMAGTAKSALSIKVIENMQAYRSLQKLKKSVLMYIATQTSEKEVSALKELFVGCDKDGDGKLSTEDMQEALKAYKGSVNVKDLLEAIDTDKSGFIDYTGKYC